MANGDDPLKSLPVIRHVTGDDSSDAESLLEDFRQSKLAEGIQAEDEREFARRAQERTLEAIQSNRNTDMPSVRVAAGIRGDVPDDDVWNVFQKSKAFEQENISSKEEAEQWAREKLMSNTGVTSPPPQREARTTEDGGTDFPKLRRLLGDRSTPDDRLLNQFRQSKAYDPNSNVPVEAQAETFAEKKLYTKVNAEIQRDTGGKQQGLDFSEDPEDKEKSWTQWMLETFTVPDEEEQGPVSRIAEALGNEDVETGRGVLDFTARTLDVPAAAIEFGGELAARGVGSVLDLGELILEEGQDVFEEEPPKESFHGTDLPDVPGLHETGAAKEVLDEDGNVRPADDLIIEAHDATDPEKKKALFKAATMKRRKDRFDDMSLAEKFARGGKLFGHGLADAVLGFPRQVSAFRNKIEEQIAPEQANIRLDDNLLARISDKAERFTKRNFPVDRNVEQTFLWDVLPQALGSMTGFMATGAVAGSVARGSAALRSRALGTAGRTQLQVSRAGRAAEGAEDFGQFIRRADTEDVQKTLGDLSPTGQRLRSLDEITGARVGAGVRASDEGRKVIARNADDVEEALTVGGNPRFSAPGELSAQDRATRIASRVVPGIQGGGMTGFHAYERFKNNPDPRLLGTEARELLERQRAGEQLTPREQRTLEDAIEEQSMNAFWTSAPGGMTEAVVGRFADTMLDAGKGLGPGIGVASLKGAGVEFTQETFQSAYDDAARQFATNPDLKPFENLLEEGLAGAISGGVMGGISAGIRDMRSSAAELERLNANENTVPTENLGVARGQIHQKRRAKEAAEGEVSIDGKSYARSLFDIENERGASQVFPFDHRSSETVKRLVRFQDIEDGNLAEYAEEPELRRQERVGKAIGAVIDRQNDLSEEDKTNLKSRFFFHDVNSRPLTGDEVKRVEVFEEGDNFVGATKSDVFNRRRFGDAHIFADASQTDAFEELFHSLYEFGGEEARQRALEAYNEVEGESLESYDENQEKIARRFAEEMERQADIEPGSTTEQIRQAFSSLADTFSPDNAIEREVRDVISGEASFQWDGPVSQRDPETGEISAPNHTQVVVTQNSTHVNPAEGSPKSFNMGLYQMDEPGRESIQEWIDQTEESDDAGVAYIVRPDPARAASSGESLDGLVADLEQFHSEFRAQREVIEQQLQEEFEGVERAEDDGSPDVVRTVSGVGEQEARVAAQQPETSEGIPDLENVSVQELKDMGFRHPNHAANAVNKDRRERGREEYGEDETVPREEVEEASRRPERLERRAREQREIPGQVETDIPLAGNLLNLTEGDVQQAERVFRRRARNMDVRAGEQDALRGMDRRIDQLIGTADRLRSQAEETEPNRQQAELEFNARKAERLANAIALGVNDRLNQIQTPSEEVEQVDLSGTPQAWPRDARIPTNAEARYVPQLGRVFAWDPSQSDPTGTRDFFENLPSVATRQLTDTEGRAVPDVEGGDPMVIDGLAQVVRVTEQETFTSEDGTEFNLSRVQPEDAGNIPARLEAPIEQISDREGTWVPTEQLEEVEGFVERQEALRQQARNQNRQTAAQQAADAVRTVRQQLRTLPRVDQETPDIDLSQIERADPTDVQERNEIEQLIFEARRAIDDLFADNRRQARERLLEVQQAVLSEDGPDVQLDDPGAAENDTDAKQALAEAFSRADELREEGVPDIDTPDPTLRVENKEEMREALVELNIEPEQAEAVSELFDARAEAFSQQTGLSKSVWYKSRIAELTGQRQGLSEEALQQIRSYHGTPKEPFDQVRDDYVDTGEGTQYEGWGHYSTGSEGVATNYYADRLAKWQGGASWSVLGGQYQVEREQGEPVLQIRGPDGNELATVDQEEFNDQLTTQQRALKMSLEEVRRTILFDAEARGLVDENFTGRLEGAEQEFDSAREAQRQRRFDFEHTVGRARLISQILDEIKAFEGAGGLNERSVVDDLDGDIKRAIIATAEVEGSVEGVVNRLERGNPAERVLDPSESDVVLTAESETDVTSTQASDWADGYSDNALVDEALSAAVETGYAQAVAQEHYASERLQEVKSEIRNEIEFSQEELTRTVMEWVLHEGRSPEEYHYIRWRQPPTREEWDMIEDAVDVLDQQDLFQDQGLVDPSNDPAEELRLVIEQARVLSGQKFRVRLRNDPDRVGEITGRTREVADRTEARVLVDGDFQWVPVDQLVPVEDVSESEFRATLRATEPIEILTYFGRAQPDFGLVYKRGIKPVLEGTEKDISKALLEAGIDGTVYRGNAGHGDYENYVTYDDSEVTIRAAEMFQIRSGDVTGAIDFLSDGRAQIFLAENADADTVVEEMGHLLLEDMPYSDRQIVADALRGELGNPNITPNNLREITEAHEQFADWFRRYVREGQAPTSTLRRIFERIKQIIADIWQRPGFSTFVEDRVPQDVRAAMDRLFLPEDPRARMLDRTEDPTGQLEELGASGLREAESGTRVFFSEKYAEDMDQGVSEHHERLTPREYLHFKNEFGVDPVANEPLGVLRDAFNENPDNILEYLRDENEDALRSLLRKHRRATNRALENGQSVPNASLKEYFEGAPDPILERLGLDDTDIGALEAEQSDIRDGLPPDQVESQVETESEVDEQGNVRRDLSDEQLELLGVNTRIDRDENAFIEPVEKGKHVLNVSDPEYVTPEVVQSFYEDAVSGDRATQYENLQSAISSDQFMDAGEVRAFLDREETDGESNTVAQRERFNETQRRINEIMGSDNQYNTFEDALVDVTDDIIRNFRQARELYEQLQVARKQGDYPLNAEERTDTQNRLRQEFSYVEERGGLSDQVVENLTKTDPDNAPALISEDEQAKRDRAQNEDLSWQEQGRDFGPVEWFGEFWFRQSSRSREETNKLRKHVEGAAPDFLAGGEQVIEFGTPKGFPESEGRDIWRSLSMKDAEALNGGLLYPETGDQNQRLASEGIVERAILVTPEFTLEHKRVSSGTWEMVIREPTEEELDRSKSERDQLAWEASSSRDARALTETTSDYHNDTFGPDEGEHSIDEKIDRFAATRPTYELDTGAVLTERVAHGGRSSSDQARFSLIAPEAQGPVSVFYDPDTGELGFATGETLSETLAEAHGDDIRNRIDEIREQDEGGPDLFGEEDLVSTESVSENVERYVNGLRDMLGVDNRIAVINPKDIDPDDPGPFTGEHRSGRLIPHDAINEMSDAPTWVGNFGNGDYYVVVREDMMPRESYQAEAIAHEFGHIVFQERLQSDEHAEARGRLREEHVQSIDLDRTVEEHVEDFMSYHRLRSSEYIDSVGDLTMGELMEQDPRMFRYLTRFDEWVAEQTARYMTTRDAVLSEDSVVKRLYNELSRYFKNIYHFLMTNGFGPNVRFAEWMDHHLERKETASRRREAVITTRARPYNNEKRASNAIDEAQQQIDSAVLEDVRDAVRNGEGVAEVISNQPEEDHALLTRYASAFRTTRQSQDREMPESSFTVAASYATSPPTRARQDERWSDVLSRYIRNSTANEVRRGYYTTVVRHVRLLGQRYPILQDIADEIFASPTDRPDKQTFNEELHQRRNEFLPRLADILRRAAAGTFFADTRPGWFGRADSINQLMEILRDEDLNARDQAALEEAGFDEQVAREAGRLREFLDDFFEYLVDKNAVPEGARLENYFPASMDMDAVMAEPQEFEDMLFDQMRRRAAENQGEDPETFELDAESRRKAKKLANKLRKGVTEQGGDNEAWDYIREQDETFQNLISAPPESLRYRYFRFLNHNNERVQDFYEQDPVKILHQYVSGNIRYAEFADRFGPDGEKVQAAVDILEEAGAPEHVPKRLKGLAQSIRGQYAGHMGRGWQEKIKGQSTSAKISRAADSLATGFRNFVTWQMMQAVGLFSTAPETMAIPLRTGWIRAMQNLPFAAKDWASQGISEWWVRTQQRLGLDIPGLMESDPTRDREGFLRMLHESGALADRTFDEIVRSRVRASGDMSGSFMKWFFNLNLLRPIERLQRTWASKAGHMHIVDALKNAERSPRLSRELERLGLPTDEESRIEVLETVDRMTAGEEAAWETDEAQTYLTALERLAQQTIVQGNAATRPLWMSSRHPLLRLHGQFKSFAAAYREGPLAYMQDETIEEFYDGNSTEGLRQSLRMLAGLLAMGGAAALADWGRWATYYDTADPVQREVKREMLNQLNFSESLESLQRGEFGRAADQVSGLPRIIERTGVPGTATFGTYYPITSVRQFDSNFFIELGGPAISQSNQLVQHIAKGQWDRVGDFALRAFPGGQAMRFREQYSDWIQRNAPIIGRGEPDPLFQREEGTSSQE